MAKSYPFLFIILGILLSKSVLATDEEEVTLETVEKVDDDYDVIYGTPRMPSNAYLAETFDDISSFEKHWIKSNTKKDGVDIDIAKYDGLWAVESAERESLAGDRGLVLKSKAKHAAIAVLLKKPYRFTNKPFVVQYEVNFQNGQECGGAYIKLLSTVDTGLDLKNFNDKTPYTIMFGPDKCGNDHKLHFIFRHANPLTNEITEKHAKRPKDKLEEVFKDKKSHLYTLILHPDNSYEIKLDHNVVNSGNLLEDFTPPVNPEKEIDDPEDFMPENWDEREKIPDPAAAKPEDWNEDAPKQIQDPSAVKPSGWLDDEVEMIPDPSAEKPEDWDEEMDGEWEAPLINNPTCEEAPGCGEWKPPMIDNPEYKGKWKPTMIDNPNYRGKWKPRKIPNPDYYEDLEPFKMTPVAAVGLELWSMSDGIYFDNILITDTIMEAEEFAQETFDLKVLKIEKGQAGVFGRILNYSNKNPWLYGIYVLVVAIPVVLIFAFCCVEDSKTEKGETDDAAEKKKTDDPTEDDPCVEDADGVEAGSAAEGEAEEDDDDDGDGDDGDDGEDDDGVDGDEEGEEGKESEKVEEAVKLVVDGVEVSSKKQEDDVDIETATRTSPRLRKPRKE